MSDIEVTQEIPKIQDPIYTPAMQMVIQKTRELVKGTPDTILSKVYRKSIEEGIKCSNKPDVESMLKGRLEHIDEMMKVHGHSEVAKEFNNVIEGMIANNSQITEKQLGQFIKCVTMEIHNTAKQVQ